MGLKAWEHATYPLQHPHMRRRSTAVFFGPVTWFSQQFSPKNGWLCCMELLLRFLTGSRKEVCWYMSQLQTPFPVPTLACYGVSMKFDIWFLLVPAQTAHQMLRGPQIKCAKSYFARFHEIEPLTTGRWLGPD